MYFTKSEKHGDDMLFINLKTVEILMIDLEILYLREVLSVNHTKNILEDLPGLDILGKITKVVINSFGNINASLIGKHAFAMPMDYVKLLHMDLILLIEAKGDTEKFKEECYRVYTLKIKLDSLFNDNIELDIIPESVFDECHKIRV